MHQAIITKFLGPTSHRPARITATADAGSVTVAWEAGRPVEWNHQNAAMALVTRLGWSRAGWQGGGFKNGYVFVQKG